MTPLVYPIKTAAVCPHCSHDGKWATDSSRLRIVGGDQVLDLVCPHPQCRKPFELDMVTGRTAFGRSVPVGPPSPPARAGGPVIDHDWARVGARAGGGGLTPILDDLPMAAPPPTTAPLPPRPPVPLLDAVPAAVPKPPPPAVPVPKPTPPQPPPTAPEDVPAMATSPAQSKNGFWKKFAARPLWQQWGLILLVVALIGVAIFLSPIPLGGSEPARK